MRDRYDDDMDGLHDVKLGAMIIGLAEIMGAALLFWAFLFLSLL